MLLTFGIFENIDVEDIDSAIRIGVHGTGYRVCTPP